MIGKVVQSHSCDILTKNDRQNKPYQYIITTQKVSDMGHFFVQNICTLRAEHFPTVRIKIASEEGSQILIGKFSVAVHT